MARKVQIDFTDRMIKIGFQGEDSYLRVHKHLLSGRSNQLEAAVNKGKGYLCWTWTFLGMRAASRYVGFLYGQPMWAYAPGANIDSEWSDLNEIYHFSTEYEDFNAADACLDGMRDILQHWRNDIVDPFDIVFWRYLDFGEPCGRLIVDYMVHRSCDVRGWIDSYEGWIDQDEASLEEALSKKFSEEAQRKRDKIEEPDLMERCRYHFHREKGLPCYLDQ